MVVVGRSGCSSAQGLSSHCAIRAALCPTIPQKSSNFACPKTFCSARSPCCGTYGMPMIPNVGWPLGYDSRGAGRKASMRSSESGRTRWYGVRDAAPFRPAVKTLVFNQRMASGGNQSGGDPWRRDVRLLAKVPLPEVFKHPRPIALFNASAKIRSRLVFSRPQPFDEVRDPWRYDIQERLQRRRPSAVFSACVGPNSRIGESSGQHSSISLLLTTSWTTPGYVTPWCPTESPVQMPCRTCGRHVPARCALPMGHGQRERFARSVA